MMAVMKTKLLPAGHTGKIRHHRHTSYGFLAAVLALAVAPLVAASCSVALVAADSISGPVTEDYTTYAVVPGPPPKTAPAVTNISSGATYTTNDPITVIGTCPDTTLVKVLKNDVLAGAALCQAGHFSVPISLFSGSNALVARAYNANNEASPDSTPIMVRLAIPGVPANTAANTVSDFFITSDVYYRGVEAGTTTSWQITLTGGQAPYAVNIGWGDGKSDLISRGQPGVLTVEHTYKNPGKGYHGSYNVTATATDQLGNKAFLRLVSIVSGTSTGVASTVKQGYDLSGTIRMAWQVLAAAILVVIAFWLGERREALVLRRQQMGQHAA
jgi:hypothetical protein